MNHLKDLRDKRAQRRERNSGSQTSTGKEEGNQLVQPEVQEPTRSRASSIARPSSSSSSKRKDKDKDKEPQTKYPSAKSNELISSLPESCQRAVLAEFELLTNEYLSYSGPSRSILPKIVSKFPSRDPQDQIFIPIERAIFEQRFVQLFGLSDREHLWREQADIKTPAEFKLCKPEEFTVLFKYPARPHHEEVKRVKDHIRRVRMYFARPDRMNETHDDLVNLVIQAMYYELKIEQRELHKGLNGFRPLEQSEKEREEVLEELSKPLWEVIETKMGIPKERLESAKLWAKAYEKYRDDYHKCLG